MGCGSSKQRETSEPERKPYSPPKAAAQPAASKPAAAKPAPAPAATKPPVTAVEPQPTAPATYIPNKLGPISDDYDIGDTLGRGAFAEVKKAIFRPTSDPRAIKIIHKLGLSIESMDPKHKLREIKVLSQLDHPNILRVHQLYEDRNRYYIVMEYCEGGDLFTRLQEVRKFTEVQVGKIMYQLLSAVSYCHQRYVIHRDLKPENLLLENREEVTLKIADFGSSSFIDPKKRLSGVHGSAYYIAPEVLKESYNEKCDLWSCGIIMYILLTGKPPYIGKTEKEILSAVYAGNLDVTALQTVSQDARDLTNQLLTKDFRLRPSAADALNHSFIQRSRAANAATGPILSTALTNLKAFNGASKLKDAIYTFIATQIITQADMRDLRESFQSIDKNGDGKISREELLEKYKMTMATATAEREVAEIMTSVDTNQSGFIDYTEFLKASMNKAKHLSQKNLEATFRLFDKDSSGKISAVELRQMLEGGEMGGSNSWTELIREVDQNGDGEIDLHEFESLLLKRL